MAEDPYASDDNVGAFTKEEGYDGDQQDEFDLAQQEKRMAMQAERDRLAKQDSNKKRGARVNWKNLDTETFTPELHPFDKEIAETALLDDFEKVGNPKYEALKHNLALVRNEIMDQTANGIPGDRENMSESDINKTRYAMADEIGKGLTRSAGISPFDALDIKKASDPFEGPAYIYEFVREKGQKNLVQKVTNVFKNSPKWDLSPYHMTNLKQVVEEDIAGAIAAQQTKFTAMRPPPGVGMDMPLADMQRAYAINQPPPLAELNNVAGASMMAGNTVTPQDAHQMQQQAHTLNRVENLDQQTRDRSVEIGQEILRKMRLEAGQDMDPAMDIRQPQNAQTNSVENLDRQAKEQSIAIAREILEKMRRMEPGVDNMPNSPAKSSNAVQSIVDSYTAAATAYVLTHPEHANFPTLTNANDAVGKLAFRTAAMALQESIKGHDKQAEALLRAQIAEMPAEWQDITEPTGALVDKVATGFAAAAKALGRSGLFKIAERRDVEDKHRRGNGEALYYDESRASRWLDNRKQQTTPIEQIMDQAALQAAQQAAVMQAQQLLEAQQQHTLSQNNKGMGENLSYEQMREQFLKNDGKLDAREKAMLAQKQRAEQKKNPKEQAAPGDKLRPNTPPSPADTLSTSKGDIPIQWIDNPPPQQTGPASAQQVQEQMVEAIKGIKDEREQEEALKAFHRGLTKTQLLEIVLADNKITKNEMKILKEHGISVENIKDEELGNLSSTTTSRADQVTQNTGKFTDRVR